MTFFRHTNHVDNITHVFRVKLNNAKIVMNIANTMTHKYVRRKTIVATRPSIYKICIPLFSGWIKL